jgi:hypothetical protein
MVGLVSSQQNVESGQILDNFGQRA